MAVVGGEDRFVEDEGSGLMEVDGQREQVAESKAGIAFLQKMMVVSPVEYTCY